MPTSKTAGPAGRPQQNTFKRTVAAALALLQLLPAASVYAQQTVATQYEYDAQGNLTKITDPNGKVTVQEPDALNRIKKQTSPAPSSGASTPQVSYTYDGLNRLTSVTDPQGNTTTYSRIDLDGTLQTSPDTGQTYR